MKQYEATLWSYDHPVLIDTAVALGNNPILILWLVLSLGLSVSLQKFLLPFPTCKVGPLGTPTCLPC